MTHVPPFECVLCSTLQFDSYKNSFSRIAVGLKVVIRGKYKNLKKIIKA